MKKTSISISILAISIASISAASVSVNTVGTINGNGKTTNEAAGNSLTVTTFATNIATAFAANTGGVWNFESAFNVDPGQTITLNYGASQANSVVLTLGGGNINQSASGGEATSGGNVLGITPGGTARTYTPDMQLLTVGFFNTDRNSAGRNPQLTVIYQDTTTASTSGANADNVFFHGLSGTAANPIVSFTISQSDFVRYDDLGFIVVPEPSSALLLGLVGFTVIIRRRR